jgi:hypothetical protein
MKRPNPFFCNYSSRNKVKNDIMFFTIIIEANNVEIFAKD